MKRKSGWSLQGERITPIPGCSEPKSLSGGIGGELHQLQGTAGEVSDPGRALLATTGRGGSLRIPEERLAVMCPPSLASAEQHGVGAVTALNFLPQSASAAPPAAAGTGVGAQNDIPQSFVVR